MQMTEEEIWRSYRLAKDPKKQIGILADINGASKEEIKQIIERCKDMQNAEQKSGLISKSEFDQLAEKVTKQKRKYTRRNKVENEPEKIEADNQLPKADDGSRIPHVVFDCLKQRVDALEMYAKAAEADIRAYRKQQAEIEAFLKAHKVAENEG